MKTLELPMEGRTSPRREPAWDEDVLTVSAVLAKATLWGAAGAMSGIAFVLLFAMAGFGLGASGATLVPWIWAAAFAAAAAGITAGGMIGGMRAMHAFDAALSW